MKNNTYKICTKTVMDTSDPSIRFDMNGISDHFHDFNDYILPTWNHGKNQNHILDKYVSEIKKHGKNQEFDCILGLSGGFDSSYMLHYAVKELGLRPLVFHVDGGWNTETSVHNIDVLVSKLNLDLYTQVIDWDEMRDFQLAFIKSGVPYLDIPQDHAFIASLYHFAHKHKIKYIINGGNFSTECVQYPIEYYYYGTDMPFLNDIISKYSTIQMKTYPFSSILFHKVYLRYLKGIKVFKLLNYTPYIKNDAQEVLETEYGWKPYPQKHFESRFTRFFEGYLLPSRFGFDPRRVQLSSLILSNQITREEALNIIDKPSLSEDFVQNEFKFISNKLEISMDELNHYFSLPKKYYWDYKNQRYLFNFGATILRLIGVEKAKKRK